MKRFAFLLPLALALAACSGTGQSDQPPAPANGSAAVPSAPAVALLDERAMFAAETLYNVPAQAYVAADALGKLTPANKAKLKPVMIQAFSVLQKVRLAYRYKDTLAFVENVELLKVLTGQASALIPHSVG